MVELIAISAIFGLSRSEIRKQPDEVSVNCFLKNERR